MLQTRIHTLFRKGMLVIISALQKCTIAMKILAYGGPADFLDDVIRMGKSTILECLKEFSRTEYLRPPNVDEVNQILASNASRGFLGMLSSIDCMH
jgi:hypothetical protein